MNFYQLFQKYHSSKANLNKSNTLYTPSQTLILENPVKKYKIPPDFFSKINAISAANINNTTTNTNSSSWRKIMYINTDLDYNFDEQVSQENALINLNQDQVFIKPKILSYIFTSIFIVIPLTYYLYNSQSFQSKK
jgi:hypothetical protein